jgi:hypothetical protein
MNGMSGLQGMGMNSMSGFGSALAKAPIPWPSKTFHQRVDLLQAMVLLDSTKSSWSSHKKPVELR